MQNYACIKILLIRFTLKGFFQNNSASNYFFQGRSLVSVNDEAWLLDKDLKGVQPVIIHEKVECFRNRLSPTILLSVYISLIIIITTTMMMGRDLCKCLLIGRVHTINSYAAAEGTVAHEYRSHEEKTNDSHANCTLQWLLPTRQTQIRHVTNDGRQFRIQGLRPISLMCTKSSR